MVALGPVRLQLQRGEDGAQKEPRAQLAAHEVGVLALPAKARRLPQRLFHHRRGVDENLDLRRAALALGLGDEPASEPLQPLLDHVVIVAVLGIDRDRRPVALLEHRHRIMPRAVILGQHDHRARLGPECLWVAAPMRALRHPAHLPMPPCLEERRQPPCQLRHVAGAADLARGEPLLRRFRHQLALQRHPPALLYVQNTPGESRRARRGQRPLPALRLALP